MFGRLLICLSVTCSASAMAQVGSAPSSYGQSDSEGAAPLDANQASRIAQSQVGQVGQRQDKDSSATKTGIKPMARLSNRIQNRVQSRINSRIDPVYDPQADTTTDPFAVAEDRVRVRNRPR